MCPLCLLPPICLLLPACLVCPLPPPPLPACYCQAELVERVKELQSAEADVRRRAALTAQRSAALRAEDPLAVVAAVAAGTGQGADRAAGLSQLDTSTNRCWVRD